MKRFFVAAVLTALALPVFASLSTQYKDWGLSPQAYFMTKAERAQWGAVQSDDEAKAFVDKFVASRGGQAFVDGVAKRAQMADKYLTVGVTPGSRSLRGKLVILLGPPASLDVAAKPVKNNQTRSGFNGAAPGGTDDSSMGITVDDVQSAKLHEGMQISDSGARLYTFAYPAATSPTKKSLSVVFEVDTKSGADKLPSRAAKAELDDVFEGAAAASTAGLK